MTMLSLPPDFRVLGSKWPSLPDSPLDRREYPTLVTAASARLPLYGDPACPPHATAQTQRLPAYRAIEVLLCMSPS